VDGRGDDAYPSTLSPEDVERLRGWHERAYHAAREEGATSQTFEHLGVTLVVPPNVMPITPFSRLLGEAVLAEVREGDRVLDMGTGSGVNAVLAATKGADVVAVDISPQALDAARHNAARNGVADRIDVHRSDVFSDVEGTFDVIVFDPPFRWFRPRDALEAALTDENYRALTTFFRQARGHLSPGGRILLFFGSSGDLDYVRALADGEGFANEVLARAELERDGRIVEYFTFRLTWASPDQA
jgi:release factor glutamine methyltransferase